MGGTLKLMELKGGARHIGRRRGAALLVCMFVMLIVSSLVVLALDIQTTEMALTRNRLNASKAFYLADAGLQHALAKLRADRSWRTSCPPGPLGPSSRR